MSSFSEILEAVARNQTDVKAIKCPHVSRSTKNPSGAWSIYPEAQLSCKIGFGIMMEFSYLQRLLDIFAVFSSVRCSSFPRIITSDNKFSALANFRPHFGLIYSVQNTSLWFYFFILQTFRLLQAVGSVLQLVLRRIMCNSCSVDFWYMTFLHLSVTERGWFQFLCLYWKNDYTGK